MQHCKRCNEIKPIEEFYVKIINLKKLPQSYCKICSSEYNKELRAVKEIEKKPRRKKTLDFRPIVIHHEDKVYETVMPKGMNVRALSERVKQIAGVYHRTKTFTFDHSLVISGNGHKLTVDIERWRA